MEDRTFAFDLDGTLLPYGHSRADNFNRDLLARLKIGNGDAAAILTNQGGLNFAGKERWGAPNSKYPTPKQIALRLHYVVRELEKMEVAVILIRVAVFHPAAYDGMILSAHDMLQHEIAPLMWPAFCRIEVSTKRAWRKPSPGMFRGLPFAIDTYFGDSDEDGEAAANVGVKFAKVERWMG